MKAFNELPVEERARIRNTLKAYDEVVVFYENGKYVYGVCLKSHYAPDHEYIGTYRAEDIYTEDERIENYINEFHAYPPNYKGKRDYFNVTRRMDEEREYDSDTGELTQWIGKIIDGDFVLTHKVTRKLF